MVVIEDTIENIIGKFGRYQSCILILISIGRLPTEFQLTNVVFILPSVKYKCLDPGIQNPDNYCPCNNPQYDESVIKKSVVTEWNLICNEVHQASLAQSIIQVGILLGSLFYGYTSDRYGRKCSSISALFCAALFGTLSAVMPGHKIGYWLFMACRLLTGMSIGGTMLCCYILLIELTGRCFRPYLIALEGLAHIFGYFVLPIIAYYIREWRLLMVVTSAPWLLVIIYFWIIPESPRWLITVGKRKQAIELLTHIAKRNKMPTEGIEQKIQGEETEKSGNEKRGTYLDLFKTRRIRNYAIFTSLMWMSCAHTFFGINQYIGRLGGNLYLNVMISALWLLPGLVFVVLATLYFKRRISIIISFSLPAVAFLLIIFVPKKYKWAILTLAMIGQLGTYVAFILIYCYSAEVFPTYIRNSAMGFSSVFARFGSFLAPFVVNIGVQWISMTIFSVLAFSAGLLCIFLPETKDTVLLNTMQQVETRQNQSNRQPSTGQE